MGDERKFIHTIAVGDDPFQHVKVSVELPDSPPLEEVRRTISEQNNAVGKAFLQMFGTSPKDVFSYATLEAGDGDG